VTPQIRAFFEICQDLEKALAWVEQHLGKIFNDGSRARGYLRDAIALNEQWAVDGGKAVIEKRTLDSLLNSMTQADTIGQVIGFLSRHPAPDAELVQKIFESLQGPLHPKDESAKSNQARNLFFELRILSQCLKAGLPAESCLHPDVKTWLDGVPIHIECKRVFAASKIESLVSSGRKQLRSQIEQAPDVLGIIALDLTRPLTDSPRKPLLRKFAQVLNASL
jgi:hypothetical protein